MTAVALVMWSPYKGEIPGHTLREAVNEAEAGRLAADIPDGLSPVAALGAVCKPLGWELYVRKNGGARWQKEEYGAEVDAQGILTVDAVTPFELAETVKERYAIKASTIPGARFSSFVAKDMRRRHGLSASEAGSAMLLPADSTEDLKKLQYVVHQFGATFAILPVPDPLVFTHVALVALAKEIQVLANKVDETIRKAWQSAKGEGRVKAYTQEKLNTELQDMLYRLQFWAEILEADPAEEKALLEHLQVELKEAFQAVASYRNNKTKAPSKIEIVPIDEDEDEEDDSDEAKREQGILLSRAVLHSL